MVVVPAPREGGGIFMLLKVRIELNLPSTIAVTERVVMQDGSGM
jgi:hypothetical protein